MADRRAAVIAAAIRAAHDDEVYDIDELAERIDEDLGPDPQAVIDRLDAGGWTDIRIEQWPTCWTADTRRDGGSFIEGAGPTLTDALTALEAKVQHGDG